MATEAITVLPRGRRRIGLSGRIVIAIVAGTAVGLFFGERTSVLAAVSDAYVKLLQMTVLPYITLSLVGGLGAMDRAQASRLGSRVGLVLLTVWAIALVAVFCLPAMFPHVEAASFFSTTLLDTDAAFDLIALYVPSNPFHALANNTVPAVVLFSALLGIALMAVPAKQTALAVIQVLNTAVARLARFIVALTPYGLFAIAAVTAGTLDPAQATQLQVYLACYLTISLLLSLWVLPGLVAAVTPIPHGALLTRGRDALMLAFATGSVLVTLPMLAEQSRALLRDYTPLAPQDEQLPDLIVPAAYNFPSTGKLLSIGFILFAAWFTGASISPANYPALGATGLLVLFGSVNAAVPFLLDMFRIPADTFQLYLATGVFSARFGTLLSAVHMMAVALVGSCAVAGVLRLDSRKLLRFAVSTVLLAAVVIGGTRLLVGRLAGQAYDKDKVLAGMETLRDRGDAVVYRGTAPPLGEPKGSVVERIRERGFVRVGYFADSLPYVYTNVKGDLVGFDVEMALQLASDLGVRLELVPAERQSLDAGLDPSACDLVMSGVAVTADRATKILYSAPYLDETLAFVVLDHRRAEFASWDSIKNRPGLRIGVLPVPYYLRKVRAELPSADVVIIDSDDQLFEPRSPALDGLVLTAERGSAFTLLHPQYSVVVPKPRPLKVPLAYVIAGNDRALARVVDTWIELKRKDGTIDELFAHWILGRTASATHRRWSILDDVLRGGK
jgi:Na+/H+-dicarboxylate symporter/ABC-type amino acid transport substrate-binding protein